MKKVLILTHTQDDIEWELEVRGHYPILLDRNLFDVHGEYYSGLDDTHRYRKQLQDISMCDCAIGELHTYAPALSFVVGYLVARGKPVYLYSEYEYPPYPFNQLVLYFANLDSALEALDDSCS